MTAPRRNRPRRRRTAEKSEELVALSRRRVDPGRLFGFFMFRLSCHFAVKADRMALHHAPMTKHYLTALAAGHRYGLCFPVEYQSGFCFLADSFYIVISLVPNCQGSDQANPR
jgi:hypothetical protein